MAYRPDPLELWIIQSLKSPYILSFIEAYSEAVEIGGSSVFLCCHLCYEQRNHLNTFYQIWNETFEVLFGARIRTRSSTDMSYAYLFKYIIIGDTGKLHQRLRPFHVNLLSTAFIDRDSWQISLRCWWRWRRRPWAQRTSRSHLEVKRALIFEPKTEIELL